MVLGYDGEGVMTQQDGMAWVLGSDGVVVR